MHSQPLQKATMFSGTHLLLGLGGVLVVLGCLDSGNGSRGAVVLSTDRLGLGGSWLSGSLRLDTLLGDSAST